MMKWMVLGLLAGLGLRAHAQDEPRMRVPKVVPVPKIKPAPAPVQPAFVEPQDPPPQNYVDPLGHVSFHLGPGFRLVRKDKEISTFHLDARSAPAAARVRAVAMMEFNPFPLQHLAGGWCRIAWHPAFWRRLVRLKRARSRTSRWPQ